MFECGSLVHARVATVAALAGQIAPFLVFVVLTPGPSAAILILICFISYSLRMMQHLPSYMYVQAYVAVLGRNQTLFCCIFNFDHITAFEAL